MSPPSPIPEHEFERFLRELGLEGKRKGKEYAAYRKSDGKLIAGFAVRHLNGKREVLIVYRKNILAALELIREEEKAAQAESLLYQTASDEWRNADWHKKQLEQAEEDSLMPPESENQDEDEDDDQ